MNNRTARIPWLLLASLALLAAPARALGDNAAGEPSPALFEARPRRVWLDGSLDLALRAADGAERKPRIGKVVLVSAAEPRETLLDLTSVSQLSADRKRLEVGIRALRRDDEEAFRARTAARAGLLAASKAYLCVYYREDGAGYSPAAEQLRAPMCEAPAEGAVAQIELQVVDRLRAALLGLAAVIGSLFLLNTVFLGLARPQPPAAPPARSRLRRLAAALSPLRLAITPAGTYSLSLTQVMIWTFVTIFGLTYVWVMTEGILAPSGQVLTLLGIGGLTALLSGIARAKAQGAEPPAEPAEREPGLGDLVKMDGLPSVFKFQMLVFTIISAAIVVKDLVEHCGFPPLPSELVALMGISSATYVGNKVLRPGEGQNGTAG